MCAWWFVKTAKSGTIMNRITFALDAERFMRRLGNRMQSILVYLLHSGREKADPLYVTV